MGIGYLLLYAALAVVALWLVAELLLQNRAPLHWRGTALAGFLGVVAGMALGSVVVIGAGAALFALGQVFVTLSVKRGYTAGWSLRGPDGSLPGPLARVPLLGALTGGAAVAAGAAAATRVGEVGAVEDETPYQEARAYAEAAAEPYQEAPYEEAAAYGRGEAYQQTPAVEQTAAFELQELSADGVYAPGYYEQQPEPAAQSYQDPYAAAYQSGYDQQPQQTGGYDQQQWQQPQPAFAYDQGYGTGYPQDGYGGGYPQQQDQQQYAAEGYPQQTGWDQGGQQQWQPEQQQGIPQQPSYDYGYQQQNTWQQG